MDPTDPDPQQGFRNKKIDSKISEMHEAKLTETHLKYILVRR
jgi:hypothetical protein